MQGHAAAVFHESSQPFIPTVTVGAFVSVGRVRPKKIDPELNFATEALRWSNH